MTTDDDVTECAYCGRTVPASHDGAPPRAEDDAAWGRIADHHASTCEWVATRAHDGRHIANDDDCASCGARAEQRTCERCGVSARIVDCGCKQQPRPIAADASCGDLYCDRCSDALMGDE